MTCNGWGIKYLNFENVRFTLEESSPNFKLRILHPSTEQNRYQRFSSTGNKKIHIAPRKLYICLIELVIFQNGFMQVPLDVSEWYPLRWRPSHCISEP